ncbi:MAG: hypothetical protein WC130_04295 [Kiritimatiellia bacterium]
MMQFRAMTTAMSWKDRIDLFMLDPEKREYAVATFEMKKDLAECFEVPPVMHLSAPQAQMLMDDLWNCGLRPSEGTGSAGALAAVQEHLKDMRKIVFNELGIS